jgi:hypothetical protein
MSKLTSVLISTCEMDIQIPFVYRRLFTLEPLTEEKLFIERENELQRFERLWHMDTRPLAVIGTSGVGKSSFINIAVQRYLSEYKIERIQPDSRITSANQFDTVWRNIQADRDADNDTCVYILEDIEKLFLRAPDGLEALKQFCKRVNNSDRQCRWIVSVGTGTWTYFNQILQIKSVFSKTLCLDSFNHDQVAKLIQGRHLMSGYQLRFDDILTDTADTHEETIFFPEFLDEIYRITKGNLRASLLYWLNAIDAVREDRIHMRSNQGLDLSPLALMSEDDALVLKMVQLHGSLSALDISQIFLWKEEFAEDLLLKIHSKGYLKVTGGMYSVHDYLKDLVDRKLPNVVY